MGVWQEYKQAWSSGEPRAMSGEEFDEIFYDRTASIDAVATVAQHSVAKKILAASAARSPGRHDRDVARVWLAVQDEATVRRLFRERREKLAEPQRLEFLRWAVEDLMASRSPRAMKSLVRRWWSDSSLDGPERETLVAALYACGLRDLDFYRSLGLDAGVGSRASARSWVTPRTAFSRGALASASGERLETLAQETSLATDLMDSGFTEQELSAVCGYVGVGAGGTALARALRELPPDLCTELERLLLAGGRDTRRAAWCFPVLRLLHMQQIMEAPRLSVAVHDPGSYLVPELALFMMGRDPVRYVPELRVLRDCDRRWRARWAETAGEAAAAMLLEDAIGLDLSTVSRIPETSTGRTADFMGGTQSGEPIVFEAKGSTKRTKHRRQMKEALKQLGKDDSSTAGQFALPSTRGRAFACSLLAAQQGDEVESRLHVADPPFPFAGLFHEGWEQICRRRHATAMLRGVRMFDLESRLEGWESEGRRGRYDELRLPVSGGHGDFVVTDWPLAEWAFELGHPDPGSLDRIRIRSGVEMALYRSFADGRVPDGSERRRGSVVGLMPGQSLQLEAGLYSWLADGSVLTVEVY